MNTTKAERIVQFYKDSPLGDKRTDKLVSWLDELGFFDAPASTKYHGAYPGGLFEHSHNVFEALCKLPTEMDDVGKFLVSYLHDICKCDQYKKTDSGYEYVKDTLLTGHGEKSVMMLYDCPERLIENEIACIRYHMGAFTEKQQWNSYTNAIHKHPDVLWVHTADMVAAHIVEI